MIANPRADRLRARLARGGVATMPSRYDGLSARLSERAGFELTLLSGVAAAAARIGAPDTGLTSKGEMLD